MRQLQSVLKELAEIRDPAEPSLADALRARREARRVLAHGDDGGLQV